MLSVDSPYVRRARRAAPSVRLICLPHAGAGASVFASWPDLLPEDVEVAAVQLPGREDRADEPAFTEIRPLVRALAQAVRPYLRRPVALFGHCAGALLAFELAEELRRRFGVAPVHLFVSGQAAPSAPSRPEAIHLLDDAGFVAGLERIEGVPAAVLADRDLMAYLLDGLRADFGLWADYGATGQVAVGCPITAFGGARDDRADPADIDRWRAHTTAGFRRTTIDGGHFFVTERAADLVREIVADLRPGMGN